MGDQSKLSEQSIKAAKPGDVLRDASISGLHLRAFPTKKAFYLYYRARSGQERRPKLGNYGSITLAQARRVAQEMLIEVGSGRDPVADRQAQKAENTLADLWAEYWKHHGCKKKTGDQDARIWRLHIEPALATSRLSTIGYTNIAGLHAGLKAKPIPQVQPVAPR